MSDQNERLRAHPNERFAGESHVFDLNRELAGLRAEVHSSQNGHRQITLSHRAPVAQVLFSFDAGGELADHAASGLVRIHVLEGQLTVQEAGKTHELSANMLMVLAPHMRHSVYAVTESAMLLTVHLDEK